MMIENLQYITQETEHLTHIDCVREACIAGIKWIQLRVKNKSEEEYLTIAKEAKIICDLYDVKLIINDNVNVAKQINAYGIHLGKSDMNPTEARQLLGKNSIIGGTANTIEDVITLINNKVDYIGLGPFQFTSTKKNLSPVLGLEGYYKIVQRLTELQSKNKIPPIIAVGGIKTEHVKDLMKTGIYGIAVSELLTNDFSKTPLLKELIEQKQYLCYK